MKLALTDHQTGGDLLLISEEAGFDHRFYSRDAAKPYFTIAWNSGPAQAVDIDGTSHRFDSQTILPLMFNQSFTFERPADVVESFIAWWTTMPKSAAQGSCSEWGIRYLFASIRLTKQS
jgi:hypothetical protein